MKENTTVQMYLSEEEAKKIEKAEEYCVLKGTALYKVLIQNGLNELKKSKDLIFRFSKEAKQEKRKYKTKMFRLDEPQYKELKEICDSTPFSMSALIKYFIMPQVAEICERKEWDYRP